MSKENMSPQSSVKDKTPKSLDNAVTVQLEKTKMCAFFERGKCASSHCRYAHSLTELRIAPNLQKTKLCRAFLSPSGCTNPNCGFAHGEGDLRVTDGIYKTQMCNFFERGYCKKGDRCNHAHGHNDLRSMTPTTAATTPLSKASESVRSKPSPLPLSELLVDSEANINANAAAMYGGIPPTPTKSVTELAQLAFSPAHSSPMWGGYGVNPLLSPAAMWPSYDAVDMLVHDRHPMSPMSPAANLFYSMGALEPQLDMFEQQSPLGTPAKTFELLSFDPSPVHRLAPGLVGGLASAEPLRFSPPGLEEPQPAAAPKEEARDPLMVNLSERLANLDDVVKCLGSDIASIKSEPAEKRLHKI